MKKKQGFTLVELAVVLVIIGILTGAVLKGQQMLETARLVRVIKDVDSVRAAATLFRTKYSNNPGDMATATGRIPECNAANFCQNGDGDSMIGYQGNFKRIQAGYTSMPYVETSMFWKHLALLGFITGVNPAANPANPAWAETHPATPIGYGYHIQHTFMGGAGANNNWNWIRMQTPVDRTGDTAGAMRPPGQNPLTPRMAQFLDQKMDDGRADLGYVMAVSGSTAGEGGPGCAISGAGGNYDISVTTHNCIIFFAMLR